MTAITVVIPVGPGAVYRRLLDECLESVFAQRVSPDEILLIDDQAHLPEDFKQHKEPAVRIWRTPWLSGVAHSFNFGVALAANDLVVMLGSDDRLEPWALADCAAAWEDHQDPHGYYYMDVQYSTGEQQSLACHAAMVHKSLWRLTGGFPVQSAIGAPDHIFISMMMAKKGGAGRLWRVASESPPYWWRVHEGQWTRRTRAYYGAVALVRDQFTLGWERPAWTKERK